MLIHRGACAPIEIPDIALADFVLAHARERGGRPALIDAATGRTVTYAQLPDLVDRAAASLSGVGLGKGDVCAVFSPNTVEYAIAVLAVARLGAIVTTASPLCTAADVKEQLRDSGAKILITS